MKFSAALYFLFFLSGIHAAAVPQLIGLEIESTSSSLKRDASGNLVPRSPRLGSSKSENGRTKRGILPDAAVPMADDPSLDPSSIMKRDIIARQPQGPASNPGEFTDVGLPRASVANYGSSANSSAGNGGPPGEGSMMVEVEPQRHHKWNSTRHKHRKEGILTEIYSHGEHIVVYNGTHYPNGTSYNPANETIDGAKLLEKVVIDGDEVVVYREPWNTTHHHHHRHHNNSTGGPMPTATGVWLPSGTGWIPSGTGRPRHHRKVPSPAYAGFRGPKHEEHHVGGVRDGSKWLSRVYRGGLFVRDAIGG